jgi:hypothetical protein
MNLELDKKICSDFPKMFVNRNASITESCMYWGFDCGDGWYDLIYTLCDSIQRYIDQNPHKEIPQVVVEQVKEKFGTLRFYTYGGDSMTEGMIWFAESMSGKLCETCGEPGEVQRNGWHYTACEKHIKEY